MQSNPTLADYPRCTQDKVRYADTDRQGHVNNAVFATFLETGRVAVLYDPERPLYSDDGEFVIARLEMDFRSEIQWPGEVRIGTGVARVGNTSLVLEQAIFQDTACAAVAKTVIVHIGRESRAAEPLTATTRRALEALLLERSAER